MVINFNSQKNKYKIYKPNDFNVTGSSNILLSTETFYTRLYNTLSENIGVKTVSLTASQLAAFGDFVYIDIISYAYAYGSTTKGASTSSYNTLTLTDGTTTLTLFQSGGGASRYNSINVNWVYYTTPTKIYLDLKNKKIYTNYDVPTYYTYSGRIDGSGAKPAIYPYMTSRTIIANNTSFASLNMNLTKLEFTSSITGNVEVYGSVDFKFFVTSYNDSGVF